MLDKTMEAKAAMESLVAGEINRLIRHADVCVYALYHPLDLDGGPLDYRHWKREDTATGPEAIPVKFDYDGIGVWYICKRTGPETFHMKHIAVEVSSGRFVRTQVDAFDGYWDEFPELVAEDRWLKSLFRTQVRQPEKHTGMLRRRGAA